MKQGTLVRRCNLIAAALKKLLYEVCSHIITEDEISNLT
jgi:hypothetical protein